MAISIDMWPLAQMSYNVSTERCFRISHLYHYFSELMEATLFEAEATQRQINLRLPGREVDANITGPMFATRM